MTPLPTGLGCGGAEGWSGRGSGSARKAQCPKSSPAAPPDPPRPQQPGRKPTTASGAGKRRELRQQDLRPRPASAQLPEPPSALPPQPLPCPPAGSRHGGGGSTNLRGCEHSPRRKREPADGGAAGGVSWEAPAPWAGTGRARGGRDGGRSSLLAHAGPKRVRRSPSAPGDSSQSLPRGGSAIPGRPRARPVLDASAPPLPPRAPGPRGLGTRSPQSQLQVARSVPGFPCGDRRPGCSDSRAGRRWPRAGTLALGRGSRPGLKVSFFSARVPKSSPARWPRRLPGERPRKMSDSPSAQHGAGRTFPERIEDPSLLFPPRVRDSGKESMQNRQTGHRG